MIRRLAGQVILTAALAVPLTGQGNEERPQVVQHRNDCRLAAQVLRTGHPAPKLQWARDYISMCIEEGPGVMAERWQAANDSAEAISLVVGSPRVRDARIYRAVLAAAADRSYSDVVRVGAMIVLAKYVDPHNGMGYPDVRPPPGDVRYIPFILAWTTGGYQERGAEPLTIPISQEVLALLQGIAAQRESESKAVWYAAAVLAKRVERDIRSGFALP